MGNNSSGDNNDCLTGCMIIALPLFFILCGLHESIVNGGTWIIVLEIIVGVIIYYWWKSAKKNRENNEKLEAEKKSNEDPLNKRTLEIRPKR